MANGNGSNGAAAAAKRRRGNGNGSAEGDFFGGNAFGIPSPEDVFYDWDSNQSEEDGQAEVEADVSQNVSPYVKPEAPTIPAATAIAPAAAAAPAGNAAVAAKAPGMGAGYDPRLMRNVPVSGWGLGAGYDPRLMKNVPVSDWGIADLDRGVKVNDVPGQWGMGQFTDSQGNPTWLVTLGLVGLTAAAAWWATKKYL